MCKKNIIFIIAVFIIVIILNTVAQVNNKDYVISETLVKNCNVQHELCKVELDGFNIEVSLDKNIFYLKKFDVSVWSDSDAGIESIKINFKMKNMNMGNNNFILNKNITEDKKQKWKVSAILPICISGRADWFSELVIIVKSYKYIIKFPILVQK